MDSADVQAVKETVQGMDVPEKSDVAQFKHGLQSTLITRFSVAICISD